MTGSASTSSRVARRASRARVEGNPLPALGREAASRGEAVERLLQDRPWSLDTGSLRGDLLAAFAGLGGLVDAGTLSPIAGVLTVTSVDPEWAEVERPHVLAAHRADVRAILERARVRGDRVNRSALDLVEPVLAGLHAGDRGNDRRAATCSAGRRCCRKPWPE
jgi:hypothetical protein